MCYINNYKRRHLQSVGRDVKRHKYYKKGSRENWDLHTRKELDTKIKSASVAKARQYKKLQREYTARAQAGRAELRIGLDVLRKAPYSKKGKKIRMEINKVDPEENKKKV